MKIPISKIKAMIKYFCSHTDNHFLGKTKLMKLFYFADFINIKRYGFPMTYDTYYHLEHGPIPSAILNLVNNVIDDPNAILSDIIQINRDSAIQKISCFEGFLKKDEIIFSEQELEILKEVCDKFGNKNTSYIENISHKEAPWTLTKKLQEIPYSLASKDSDCIVSKKHIELFNKLNNA